MVLNVLLWLYYRHKYLGPHPKDRPMAGGTALAEAQDCGGGCDSDTSAHSEQLHDASVIGFVAHLCCTGCLVSC